MSVRAGGIKETIHGRVQAAALSRPDCVAVADGTRSLTYRMLDAQANSLAHRLRSLGVGPGVRVGLCHDRSAVTVVAALATLKAGGAYVGLDPAHPRARLEYMLGDAAVPVLLTQASTIADLAPMCAEAIDLDQHTMPVRSDPPDDLATTDDAAYLIYTSGSTGKPKGVEVSHRNLLSLLDWHGPAFSVRPTDRASMVASPAFDASVWELWPYLTVGASIHIPDGVTAAVPEALRDWIVRTGITIAFAPTPLAEALLKLPWPSDTALRTMLTGGDRLTRRPAPGTPFALVNNYGVTEGTVVSTSGPVAPDPGRHDPPGIGRPIAGTRLHILDADARPVPPGAAGELHIGGQGVAIGYLGRPGLTAERFVPDPFSTEPEARMYRTGDLVRVAPDGEVHYVARLDDQVQIRGQRVEPHEVASVLGAHPAVDQCVVVTHEERPGDHRLIAYVVPSTIDSPADQELRNHLAARLPAYMVPTAFIAMSALPVSGNGKLDRDALPVPEARGDASPPAEAVTGLERAVVTILEDLLEFDGVGRDDNFFELGGHSLMAAQLVARLQDRFDVELSLLDIFDNPTAAGIAAEIERCTGGTAASPADVEVR